MDGIKLFAMASIRDRGSSHVRRSDARAASAKRRRWDCGRWFHAHASQRSHLRAVLAGCNSIEHLAMLLDGDTAEASRQPLGVYFDPGIFLVFRNYIDNKP